MRPVVRPLAWCAVVACAAVSFLEGNAAQALEQRREVPYVIHRVEVKDPVVFITIDDGVYRSKEAMSAITRLEWPVVHFVPPGMLRRNVAWFQRFGSESAFGNHTETHKRLAGRGFSEQRQEICRGSDGVSALVDGAERWLRPPYGAFDATTIAAAKACRMERIVLWNVVVDGRRISTWGGEIQRGDIILLHHRKDLAVSLDALDRRLRRLGLVPGDLGEYLP